MELLRAVLLLCRVQRLYAAGALHTALCEMVVEKNLVRCPSASRGRICHHALGILAHHGAAREDTRADRAFLDVLHTKRVDDDHRLVPDRMPHTHQGERGCCTLACPSHALRLRHIHGALLLRLCGLQPGGLAVPACTFAHPLLCHRHPSLLMRGYGHRPQVHGQVRKVHLGVKGWIKR